MAEEEGIELHNENPFSFIEEEVDEILDDKIQKAIKNHMDKKLNEMDEEDSVMIQKIDVVECEGCEYFEYCSNEN